MRLCRVFLPFLLVPILPAQTGGVARLMAAASSVNTLTAAGAQPWHILAAYQSFDEDGKPREQGTFEEFWAGPSKDRISYTSPGFTQTDYILERGHLRTGTSQGAGIAEQLVRHDLVHPMPTAAALAVATLTNEQKRIGKDLLACVTVTVPVADREVTAPLPARPIYCFDQSRGQEEDSSRSRPVLRFASSAGNVFETTFDNAIDLDRQTIARDIHVIHAGKPFLTVHVQTLEALQGAGGAAFNPPSDAIEAPPERIRISAALAQAYLTEGIAPAYPLIAEHTGKQGTVVLQVVIGVNGRVSHTMVVSAPSADLGIAAVDAVRQWTYRPYMLNGEPAEMLTEIKMNFHLPKK